MINEEISRRDALYKGAAIFGGITGGLAFGKVVYNTQGEIKADYIENKIYNELLEHVHYLDVIGIKINCVGKRRGKLLFIGLEPVKRIGGEIIFENKFLTAAHIVSPKKEKKEFEDVETVKLYKQKLESLILKPENDVAIYRLPRELRHLPDFPCKVSTNISLGEEVYVLGNPLNRGNNIRKGEITTLEGCRGTETELNLGKRETFFGFNAPIAQGDSGCPIVNKNFELVGLVSFQLRGKFSYAKRIEEFLKELEKLQFFKIYFRWEI